MPPQNKTPQEKARYWSTMLPEPMRVLYSPGAKCFEVYEDNKALPNTRRDEKVVYNWTYPARVWCHMVKRIRKDRGDENWNIDC